VEVEDDAVARGSGDGDPSEDHEARGAPADSPPSAKEGAANADAASELERLQAEIARAEARAAEAYAESAALREALRAAAGEASAAAALRDEIDAAAQRERDAATRYRDLVLRTEPTLPAELIAGDSIDAVEQSLEAARDVVDRVRQQIEQQARTARVPAGAPVRSSPDVSAMTAEQKIRHGLSQRR
jgi:hypothetical protein